MPVENRAGQNGELDHCLFVPADLSMRDIARQIHERERAPHLMCVIGNGLPTHALSVPDPGHVAAKLEPMTDAIKRVSAHQVLETVDRQHLAVVDLPLVLPIDLARRWAEETLAADGRTEPLEPGRRSTVAALLSLLVLIEPDLHVDGLDHIP